MALAIAKWTVEDYHRMIDAGILSDRHVELLNGEIVEMSPEGVPHAHLSSEGADYLRELLGNQVKIRDGKPITLPDNSEPEPDIAVCHPVVFSNHHPYPEDLLWLIEFSDSSLTKDLESKNRIYAAAAIQEYWVINLQTMQLIVFRAPDRHQYQTKMIWQQDSIAPLAFPDTEISLKRLLGK